MSRARDLHLENEVVQVRFTQVLGLTCAPENGAAAESRSYRDKVSSPGQDCTGRKGIDRIDNICCTVNVSDLDSVSLKDYKVKDCGRNLGPDDCL